MLLLAAQSLVTVSVHRITQRHLLADCWQTMLRSEVKDALCLVELRGFEPLTPCPPCHPHHVTRPSAAVPGTA
jgi:hypothetical protein